MIPGWILELILALVLLFGGFVLNPWEKRNLKAGQKRWKARTVWLLGGGLLLWGALSLRNEYISEQKRAQERAKAPAFVGTIVAGNDAMSPRLEDYPGASLLDLGDANWAINVNDCDHSIFAFEGKPFLKVRVTADALFLSATIVDHDGRDIVRVIDNEFQASPYRSFFPRQPDEHSLIVRDLDGVEALNVRFKNPREIRLVGRFRIPGYENPVEVLSDKMVIPKFFREASMPTLLVLPTSSGLARLHS